MSSTTQQLNNTSSQQSGGCADPGVSSKCCQNCQQYNQLGVTIDPRYYTCLAQESACMAGGAVANATGLTQGLSGAIISLIQAPFKALGLNGLNDALWRGLLIFLGIMVLAFGLLILSGSAVREEVNSPAGQEATQAAVMAA